MTRRAAFWFAAILVLAACRPVAVVPELSPDPSGASPDPSSSVPSQVADTIPACSAIPWITAPAELYDDDPIYVANEQPAEEIRSWAATKPGFEDLWIDRDHLGWLTVAFSQDADARQAELERDFPDVGVVAVAIEWTTAELEGLQRRVMDELSPLFPISSWTSITQGVVGVHVGVLRADRVAAVTERFVGERICIEGTDPAEAPPEGPQPVSGDGWRLLADEQGAGLPYRTGIATDQASYERLWEEIGLSGEPPPVDFGPEVVIWFGAVYGSGCPVRLDGVVVDRDRALVHGEIVIVDQPPACNSDANPHAYLVALERAELPVGGFAIQLGADDPPRGVPEERSIVEVDLSRPGSVAASGDVHQASAPPETNEIESGSVLEPGFPRSYRLFVHCGIEWLGTFNDIAWRTTVPAGIIDFVPAAWQPAVDRNQTVGVSLTLRTEPEPVIEATRNGLTVVYRPTTQQPPGCD
jgi:hypothetical protein